MQDATADIDPPQIPGSLPDSIPDADRRVKGRILETLRTIGGEKPRDRRRAIHIRFYAMPVAILGGDRVEAVRMERTRVEQGRTVGTGETFEVPCGLVVSCIGSRAQPIDGVPFDERQGTAVHSDGRIRPRVYCAGWLKRGATGTIGTNRLDSYAVADRLLSEFAEPPRPGPAKLDELLRMRKVQVIGFEDWLAIKRLEEAAAEGPAPRRKFDTIMSMLHALETARSQV
jgi:ferredoxin--NADP+ reductase